MPWPGFICFSFHFRGWKPLAGWDWFGYLPGYLNLSWLEHRHGKRMDPGSIPGCSYIFLLSVTLTLLLSDSCAMWILWIRKRILESPVVDQWKNVWRRIFLDLGDSVLKSIFEGEWENALKSVVVNTIQIQQMVTTISVHVMYLPIALSL